MWNPAQVRDALAGDPLAVDVALAYFGVTDEGNFEERGRPTGMTVLHESKPVRAVAARLGTDEGLTSAALARAKSRLTEVREQRKKPFRDEKILTSWGALTMGAMVEAGAALGETSFVASAAKALLLVERRLVVWNTERTQARALRLVKGSVAKGPGFLDDHAYLANAALDLYEVTGEPSHVALARGLVEGMLAAFFTEGDGFYFTPNDGEALIARSKDPYDNAAPSGASMACRALSRLGSLIDVKYTQMAERELVRLAPAAMANPMGFGQLLCEIDRMVRGSVDVVLVGARSDPRTQALAAAVFTRWLPNRTVAWLDPFDASSREACVALAEGKIVRDHPVAYVCRGRSCSLPVASAEELGGLLQLY